jgi:hypothetical protein
MRGRRFRVLNSRAMDVRQQRRSDIKAPRDESNLRNTQYAVRSSQPPYRFSALSWTRIATTM